MINANLQKRYQEIMQAKSNTVENPILARYKELEAQKQFAEIPKKIDTNRDVAGDFVVGFGKEALRTGLGASGLGEKMLGGLWKIALPESLEKKLGIDKRQEVSSAKKLQSQFEKKKGLEEGQLTTPVNTAQKVGGYVENIAELFVPGGASLKAGKIARALTKSSILAKILDVGARAVTEGTIFGGQTALKEGEVNKETGTSALLGATFPMIGSAASKIFRPVAKSAGERIMNSLIKPLMKDLSYGKNPSRGILRRVGSFNSFEDGLKKTGDAIEKVASEQQSILNNPLMAKERLSIRKEIEEVYAKKMADAAKQNDDTLYKRLANDRDAIMNEISISPDGTKIMTPRNLDAMTPAEMGELKVFTGKLRKWTGNPSEDKAAENAIGSLYGKMKDKLNKLGDAYGLNLRQTTEDLSDLITANKAIQYRDIIIKRQNILSLPGKLGTYGFGTIGLLTANPMAILAGVGTAGLDKVLSSPAFKTRLASVLSKIGKKERSELIDKTPILRQVFNRIFGENLPEKFDEAKILKKIDEYLKKQSEYPLLPPAKKSTLGGTIELPQMSETSRQKAIQESGIISRPPPNVLKTEAEKYPLVIIPKGQVGNPIITRPPTTYEKQVLPKRELSQILRGTKGMTADDITKTYPNIKLTKDISATDIYGKKVIVSDGEKLTPYEIKGNKILLQDGETYIVSKNQFQNIKGNSVEAIGKPFAPELEGLEETVRGGRNLEDKIDAILADEVGEGMTRTEAREFALQNAESEVATKYEKYQLPNGKNYREVLIKAPVNKAKEQQFKSSHWDEPNIISHLRLNDRTYKGKKVTFMEELQSDWAKEGRDKGFKNATDEIKTKNFGNNQYAIYKNGKFIENVVARSRADAVAQVKAENVPFNENLKNWQEISIKRALKDAVDNNSNYFAWITGEQTSARYNLATYLKNVSWKKGIAKDTKIIDLPTKKGGQPIGIITDKTGKILDSSNFDWQGKKLDEVLGKGLADKIMEKESGNLSGEGLKFGGEWANNLYDKQVKNIVEDLTGQKVEVLDLGLPIDSKIAREWAYITPRGGTNALIPENLKVGIIVNKADSTGNPAYSIDYIITDILGDGKFKAVPRDKWELYTRKEEPDDFVRGKQFKKYQKESLELLKKSAETFDISQKITQQQGIKLTPEVKNKIKGLAPEIKTSGKMYETKSQLTDIWNKAQNKGNTVKPN